MPCFSMIYDMKSERFSEKSIYSFTDFAVPQYIEGERVKNIEATLFSVDFFHFFSFTDTMIFYKNKKAMVRSLDGVLDSSTLSCKEIH